MIRKTIYERLFDQLTNDPCIKDAEPTPDRNGVNITFTLGEGVWFYTAKENPSPTDATCGPAASTTHRTRPTPCPPHSPRRPWTSWTPTTCTWPSPRHWGSGHERQ